MTCDSRVVLLAAGVPPGLLQQLPRPTHLAQRRHHPRGKRGRRACTASGRHSRAAELIVDRLDGLGAAAADFIIIQARTGTDGISLFIVDKDAAGLKVSGYPTVDGLRAAEVTLKDVAVGGEQLLGEQNQGMDVLNEVTRQGLLAVCAEAVGIMENLYKDTVEYTRTREQFDHPLSEFQVLRHRMADMFVEYELCKSLLYRATMEKAEGAGTADQSLHALKVLVGKSGRFIAQNAVQLHGGMGLTEELRIGHYFKRMTVIESQFGGTDAHLSRYVKAMRQAL